jgi:hypothetical protein
MTRSRLRRTAGSLALTAGLLMVISPAADASLRGRWGAENTSMRIKLDLGANPHTGSLRLEHTSAAQTVGHTFAMRCHAPGRASRLVFAIQPLTGSNPINLYGASRVRGRSCTITRDGARLTRFMLHRR